MRSLHDSWELGGITIPNRVVLAPLAGIGNWFVRLQAKRYGAGLAVCEMVSSFAIHYGNQKTHDELLAIDPRERDGGPVSIQLFGHDPEIMRSAAAHVATLGADLIDINMGCPVPKVMKTGAGAALLQDADQAVAIARAAREGGAARHRQAARRRASTSRPSSPPARRGRRRGRDHLPPAHGQGPPQGHADYDLAAQLVQDLPVPVIVTGGMDGADHVRWVFEYTGCEAVMLARGASATRGCSRRCSAPVTS